MDIVYVILYVIALVIAIANAMGKAKEAPLWLAVAILAAIPLLARYVH